MISTSTGFDAITTTPSDFRAAISVITSLTIAALILRSSKRELLSLCCEALSLRRLDTLPPSLLLFQQRQQIVCCGALAQAWEDFVDAVLVRKGVHISHCIHNEDDVISMFVSMTGS
jgi:hypothetical protein